MLAALETDCPLGEAVETVKMIKNQRRVTNTIRKARSIRRSIRSTIALLEVRKEVLVAARNVSITDTEVSVMRMREGPDTMKCLAMARRPIETGLIDPKKLV